MSFVCLFRYAFDVVSNPQILHTTHLPLWDRRPSRHQRTKDPEEITDQDRTKMYAKVTRLENPKSMKTTILKSAKHHHLLRL